MIALDPYVLVPTEKVHYIKMRQKYFYNDCKHMKIIYEHCR